MIERACCDLVGGLELPNYPPRVDGTGVGVGDVDARGICAEGDAARDGGGGGVRVAGKYRSPPDGYALGIHAAPAVTFDFERSAVLG